MRLSEKKTNDLRVIKTEDIIKEVFISLVEENGYSNVTIKDIVKKAQINRNTFYLHYENKEALINKLVSDLLESQKIELSEAFEDISFNSKETIANTILEILKMMDKKIEFLRILIKDPSLVSYFYFLKQGIKEETLKNTHLNNTKVQMIIDYIISGLFGILAEWILNDSYSLEDISQVFLELCINNIEIAKK